MQKEKQALSGGEGAHAAAFTVNEAANYLRISRANIYRLFKSGELRPAKLGGRTLVRRVDADALLERAVTGG